MERRLKDAENINDFNKYTIGEHEKEKERHKEFQHIEFEMRKVKEEEMR